MQPLLDVRSMPSVDGLDIPRRFYVVIREPAPLAGMYRPDVNTPWQHIYAAGYSDIVCLAGETLGYAPAPLRQHVFEMEDLHHGNEPHDPENEERLTREATKLVLSLIQDRKGVIVHCYGGNGRTGTVIGCTLKSLGYPVDDILTYYDAIAKLRGRPGWPESPWQSRMVRDF